MKKIFTLVFCVLAAFTASAQIEIVKDGKVVKDGETIEFFATEDNFGTEEEPWYFVTCSPTEPMIVNKGAKDANVNVLVEKENASDEFSWCILNSCKPFSGASMSQSFSLKAGAKEGLQLHAEGYEAGQYTSRVVHVTVSANGQTQKITIKYTYAKDPTGIESTQADRVAVANKQLSYSFSSNADRQLNVYGVSGRLVKSESLSQNGVVALNDLHRGVYIYEITANGKRTSAHKFVIK